MDIRFVSSLLEVVRTGSIAAAARSQVLTSAAVSQRIKALELQLGCRLLSREGHTAKPTEECLRLLPRMKHLVEEVDALKSDLDFTGLVGSLRVGAISTALTGVLPPTVKHLSSVAPNLNLQIFPGTSSNLYEQLLNKTLDIIISVKPPFVCPKNVKQTTLYAESLAFICHQSQNVDSSKLFDDSPFIQYDRQSWGGLIANAYLLDNDITVDTLCELDALESIAMMVKNKMGVALTPIWLGLQDLSSAIEIRPITDAKYQREIVLIAHRQVSKEKLLQTFSNAVVEQVEHLSM